jgi:excisionase family DNA binding protein
VVVVTEKLSTGLVVDSQIPRIRCVVVTTRGVVWLGSGMTSTTATKLITTAEAAVVLGVSQRQVQRLIEKGQLTVVDQYAHVRVLAEDQVVQLAVDRAGGKVA